MPRARRTSNEVYSRREYCLLLSTVHVLSQRRLSKYCWFSAFHRFRHSKVDIRQFTLPAEMLDENEELAHRALALSATVFPGDMLYIPTLWHHQVHAQGGEGNYMPKEKAGKAGTEGGAGTLQGGSAGYHASVNLAVRHYVTTDEEEAWILWFAEWWSKKSNT